MSYIEDGYTELCKISINQSEIILAENPDAEHRYMVVENRFTDYYNNSGDNNIFTGHNNDYVKALDEFTKKVQYNIDCVKSTRDVNQSLFGIVPVALTAADCIASSGDADYTGKLIVVKTSELKPEYRAAESQLVLCSHGNGARPNAIGTSVFGNELFSGDSVCYGRHQIEGVADIERLPQWAKSMIKDVHEAEPPQVESSTTNTPKKLTLQERLEEARWKIREAENNKNFDIKQKKRKDMEVT